MALDASATPVPLAAKPRLRGMLHLIAFPVSLFAGTMLVTAWARGLRATIGSAVYAVTGAVLFGVSALYHRGQWDERTHALLRRLDHSNIFLLIAGTYTPIVLMLLDGASQVALLVAVWVGALAGILFRLVAIPVIAGISYELLRLGAKNSNSLVMRALMAPGLWLQMITTKPPDRSQIEVAIASFEEVLRREGKVPSSSD